MASTTLMAARPTPPSSPSLLQMKQRDAVYVVAVPLRAANGPPQMLVSAAYSLALWDAQHFMVAIKPDPSLAQAFIFDFQPKDPEGFYAAFAAAFQRPIPGLILKRAMRRLPKSRCWFVGYASSDGVDVADKFSEDWPTDLIVGKHDCRNYTNELVEHLTGEQRVLDRLRASLSI
ncbi:uncharacterized protein LOC120267585 [Dioscorea cayenensis subsp. rotundata]|uniref:Uncharacterized protein LOC120267585 n=1 Tax=Dioscorea cayennensis subsp. rotundata TaxID=55577 RepID=A0AB40BUQ5_DIOCR|nr:uncharacterized protein LOC120267585 [Dioscorea cayenensis subsp. rotundata]